MLINVMVIKKQTCIATRELNPKKLCSKFQGKMLKIDEKMTKKRKIPMHKIVYIVC